MPDGSNLADRAHPGFRADRRLGRSGAPFVAHPLPEAPAGSGFGALSLGPSGALAARARPMGDMPLRPPAAAQGLPQVAADLRARPRVRPADATSPAAPPAIADPAADTPPPDDTPAAAPATPPQPAAPDPGEFAAKLAAAMAEGAAAGRAAALDELAAERLDLSQAAQALANALARLAEPPTAQIEAMAQAIEAAVARLATERAGSIIDTAPEGFAARVARLADRIARHPAGLTVRLHPRDLAAIRPLLAAGCAPDLAVLASARLVADAALRRGDADLHTPDVRIGDFCDAADTAPDGEDL